MHHNKTGTNEASAVFSCIMCDVIKLKQMQPKFDKYETSSRMDVNRFEINS